MAWFTDNDLFNKLIERTKAGIDVQLILFDHDTNKQGTISHEGIGDFAHYKINLNELQAVASVFLIEDTAQSFLHSKFCVIDNKTVITGSYNWTFKARYNIENIVVIDNTDVAKAYQNEFEKIKTKKYKVLIARSLPGCAHCGGPTVRARIYDFFNGISQYYEDYKEIIFCIQNPVDHTEVTSDSEDWQFHLGDLLEYEYGQIEEQLAANPGLKYSEKQRKERIDAAIAQSFGLPHGIYEGHIGNRLSILLKRVHDPEDDGETPTFEVIWNNEIVGVFVDVIMDFQDEIMDKIYPF